MVDLITTFLSEEVISQIVDSIFARGKSFVKQKLSKGKIEYAAFMDETHEDFFNILGKAIKISLENELIKAIPKDEIIDSLKENYEVITKWIYSPNECFFSSEEIKPSNYDFELEISILFKSIHGYIIQNRNNYVSFTTQHIKKIADNLFHLFEEHIYESRRSFSTLISGQNKIFAEIEKLQANNSSWPCFQILEEIERLLNARRYVLVKSKLDTIEQQIIRNQISTEIEKFYELYTNLQLSNYADQTCVIPYLEKLIIHTKDETKKIQRKILLSCIKKEYQECIREIDYLLVSSMINNEYLVEIKINCLLLSQKVNEANDYIENVKTFFKKYNYWKVKILNCLAKYDLSYSLVSNNPDYFNQKFDYKILVIETKAYYFVTEYHDTGFDFSHKITINTLISDAKKLEEELGEDLQLKEGETPLDMRDRVQKKIEDLKSE